MFVRQRDTRILKNQPEREYFILSGYKKYGYPDPEKHISGISLCDEKKMDADNT
jgi:hypothetical protein